MYYLCDVLYFYFLYFERTTESNPAASVADFFSSKYFGIFNDETKNLVNIYVFLNIVRENSFVRVQEFVRL